MRHRSAGIELLVLLALGLVGCGTGEDRETRSPAVLVGIDGASWNAIEALWQQGDLPHFRALADAGVTAEIKPVAAASPVIWTSIATGLRPERHGITGFLVPGAGGDVPVSSHARRVPAIWNMLSTLERRVAVLGWWASWPAESVNGVMVTDRATRLVDEAFWPPEFADSFTEVVTAEAQRTTPASHSAIARQDRAMSAAALSLAERGFDLLMLYLRNVDAESHPHWKYFLQGQATEVDGTMFAPRGQLVANAYRAVDQVIGELRLTAAPETNFFVVSDHGFRTVKQEQYRIEIHLDRILEHLGYLERAQGEIDWSRSRATPWASTPGLRRQPLRFGRADRQPSGPVAPEDVAELRERLTADLNQVTYESGMPALRVREPGEEEEKTGADLIAVVRQQGVTRGLEFQGEPIPDAIGSLHELTGTHDANTEGIFLAAGPDIDPQSAVELVHSLDITPTLLYALGLPIAQDFDGRPQIDLFHSAFRRRHPVRTIPSWGTRETGSAMPSDADEQLLEELRALGYLD